MKKKTTKKTSEADRKEVYRLWREYLKRSDDYKDFCDWMESQASEKRQIDASKIPEKYRKFVYTYSYFSVAHKVSFEDWWAYFNRVLETGSEYRGMAVEDYSDFVGHNIDCCISSFREREGREPTLEELKSSLIDMMKENQHIAYLKVVLLDHEKDYLVAEFGKIIKERKAAPYVKYLELLSMKPSSKVMTDEIGRYLEVYDLHKKGLTTPEIIKHFHPKQKEKAKDANILRAFYNDLKRAKNIIKNVENGHFPGDYQP